MDSRKKACPNELCKTYKNKKFNSKINYCSECGTKLIYVCKTHKCYKPLDETQPGHEYCRECEANRQDRRDKAVALAKKGGGAVAAAVVVPALQVVDKKGGALAKEVAGKGMDVVINVVKKKI